MTNDYEKSHKSTINVRAKVLKKSRSIGGLGQRTYSSSQTDDLCSRQRTIKQKHHRWVERIRSLVDRTRVLDLPMTTAITINWEQILPNGHCPKRAQAVFFRRLRRLSKRLGFDLTFIWIIAHGARVGAHGHMMLYWPHKHIKYLRRELNRLSANPYNVHTQSLSLIDRKDYYWGQYLADHIIKHAHYSQNRNFGYSRNLSAAITKIEANI